MELIKHYCKFQVLIKRPELYIFLFYSLQIKSDVKWKYVTIDYIFQKIWSR